jgi:hypothetical protein
MAGKALSKDSTEKKDESDPSMMDDKVLAKQSTALSSQSIQLSVQTTWAVLILAFLAGLVSMIGNLKNGQFNIWFPLSAIYEFLIVGTLYSIHRLIASVPNVWGGWNAWNEEFEKNEKKWGNAPLYFKVIFNVGTKDGKKILENRTWVLILVYSTVVVLFNWILFAKLY